jgi:hypothetical protein
MSDAPQTSWLTRGTFLERMAKESVIVFPVALVMSGYGVLKLSRHGIEGTSAMIFGFALLVTIFMSGFYAWKSLREYPESVQLPTGQAPIEPE